MCIQSYCVALILITHVLGSGSIVYEFLHRRFHAPSGDWSTGAESLLLWSECSTSKQPRLDLWISLLTVKKCLDVGKYWKFWKFCIILIICETSPQTKTSLYLHSNRKKANICLGTENKTCLRLKKLKVEKVNF